MALRTTVREFPFLEGTHEEVDSRILPDGYLSAATNVRLRKDGRWGVRADYDAVGNDTGNSADIVPYDLIPFDDSLLAIVDGRGTSGDTAPWDMAELVSTSPIDWRTTHQQATLTRLGRMTSLREIPALPSAVPSNQITTASRVDCAAGGGYVCVAMQVGPTMVAFHVLRADTGASVFEWDPSLGGIKPRVVVVGTKFFFLHLNTAGTTLNLLSFDPATDTNVTTLTAVSSGTAINCYDAVTDKAGTGFWVAYNLSTPTTTIVPVNSSGVAGSAITGPAVTYQHLAVRETASRVHLLSVISAGATELRSYTTGGVLSSGPTSVIATSNDRQPGLSDATTGGVEAVECAVEATLATFVGVVAWYRINATTHATIASAANQIRHAYLGSKPAADRAINLHQFFAFVRPDGGFLSHGMVGASSDSQAVVYCYKDRFAAVASAADTTPQIAVDSSTGKFYWPNLYLGADGNALPRVTEFSFASGARRQSALIGGMLYVGGALVQIFDGKTFLQAGLFDKPTIISAVASNGAGSLPSNVSLLVAATYEWLDRKGNLRQGDVSDVTTVAMGAADDTIDLVVTNPLGHLGFEAPETVAAYRSISGINQLRRAETARAFTMGSSSSITLLASDTTTRAQGVIYTQAGRGSLSGSLPHEAPMPADFIWKFGARLLCANANQAFVSKELFPGEPVNFSGAVGFTIPSIPERIVGVAALDSRGLLFTRERIYQFTGDGPNDNGEGRYSEPIAIPGSTGLMTWQSLVETPIGLFFQGSNGQLWVLPRDGSPPVWIGQPVRDTLVSYPNVTSATLVTKEQLVSFTCNNSGNTDARVVSYDLRAKTWIVDQFASSTPIAAACAHQGRLAYVSSGVVYTEKTSLTPATFITHSLTTGRFKPWGSEWGKFCTIGLVGEYRGDCNIQLEVSYNDGKSYTTHGKVYTLTSGSYAVGDTVELEWTPSRWKAEHIKLRFSALTPGSATEGFIFNKWRCEFAGAGGMSRSPVGQRG